MEQPLLPAPANIEFASGLDAGRLMSAAELGVAGDPKPEAMTGMGRPIWAGKDASRRASVRCSASPSTLILTLPTSLKCGVPVTACGAGGESRARELLDSFLGGRAAGCKWQGRAGQGLLVCACIAQPCGHVSG